MSHHHQSSILAIFMVLSLVSVSLALSSSFFEEWHQQQLQPQDEIGTSAIPPKDLIFDAGPLGRIKGMRKTTRESKREFVAFYNIPYAEPLDETRRFLPPLPLVPPLVEDGEIFDAAATKGVPCCPQMPNALCASVSSMNETTCLTVHISTPQYQKPIEKLLPVVLFIHGGAFTLGGSVMYTGERLLERDVVVVSIQYRLGIFGFFCLNTPEAPGNAAMYDMVEALAWVKKYIHHFGGDPDQITLAGQSAGSVAVTHMMLSPMTQTNETSFQGAIAMSGTALCEWGTTTATLAKEASLELAKLLNCTQTDLDQVVECMRGLPTDDLVNTLEVYQRAERKAGRLGFLPVTPTIQEMAPRGKPMFLSESPTTILEAGRQADIPLIMGSTRHDGSFVLGLVYNQFLMANNDLQNNATFLKTQMVPMLLQALGIEDPIGAVFDALADTYLGPEVKVSGNFTQMIAGLLDLHTVFFFKAAEYQTLRLHAKIQPNSYWYSFDFQGTNSLYSMLVNTTNNPVPGGVTHADDLIYIFNMMYQHGRPDEKAVSKRLTDYWANFAISGDPNIDEAGQEMVENWPIYDEEEPSYIVVNGEHSIVNDFPNLNWRGLSYELLPELYAPEETTTQPPEVPTTTEEGEFDSTSTEEPTTRDSLIETTTAGGFSVQENNVFLVTLIALGILGFFSG